MKILLALFKDVRLTLTSVICILFSGASSYAWAQEESQVAHPIRAGFNTHELARNDDGSTVLIDLPFEIDFFGIEHSKAYINKNGNITFNAPLRTYTPFGITAGSTPMIAPYFADVDTRYHGELVTYGEGMVGPYRAFSINWYDVDFYFSDPLHGNQLNQFQLVLIDRSDTGGR